MSRASHRTFAFKLGLGLLLSLALLLLGESFARVVRTVIDEMSVEGDAFLDTYLTGSPELGWVRKPSFAGLEVGITREFDDEGYYVIDSPQVHASTPNKVIFVGGSNTFGYGVDVDSSFPEIAEHLSHVDAINLGVPGYSSYQGLQVVRKYISTIHPTIAVIEFGFNDRRYAKRPDGPQRFTEVSREIAKDLPFHIRHALQFSYLYRGLRRVLRFAGWLAPAEELQVMNVDELALRVDETAYRRNLSEIALYCRQHGVRPIFMLLRDNPFETEPIRIGIAKLNSGDTAGAIRELTGVVNRDSDLSVLARHYLAQALRQSGSPEDVDRVLNIEPSLTMPDGGLPVRLDSDYSQIMQEVADIDGVDIIDAATKLESTPLDVFEDIGHINKEGHRLVGELIAAKLSTLPELSTQGTGTAPSSKAQ